MANDEIPGEVKTYIVQHISSAAQLELLLILHATRGRAWTAAELGQELRIDPVWAEDQLAELAKRNVVNEVAETALAERRYVYAPNDPALAGTVAALAQWFATHRVMIITLIYSKPTDPLRSFADAFRLRKDKADG